MYVDTWVFHSSLICSERNALTVIVTTPFVIFTFHLGCYKLTCSSERPIVCSLLHQSFSLFIIIIIIFVIIIRLLSRFM